MKPTAILSLLYLFLAQASSLPSPNPVSYRSLAYFVNWGIYARNHNPQDLPTTHLTHILYAFANVHPETGHVYLSDSYADLQKHYATDSWSDEGTNNVYGCVKQLFLLKQKNRHLKVLLSIGGWTYSGNFARAVGTPEGRRRFARSAVSLMGDLGMDGVDVDWEYPENDEQASNLVDLLREIRTELDAYSTTNANASPSSFLLSVASPAGPQNYATLHLKAMDPYLSFWNLMAYDYSGPWSPNTAYTTNLFPSPANPSTTPFNTHQAITFYLDAGIAPEKLNLGVPLYGRVFSGTVGMGASFEGVGGEGSYEVGVWDWKDLPLVRGAEEEEVVVVVEDVSGVGGSYSFDERKREVVSFDTEDVVRRKGAYIREMGLGGAMWWESSADRPVGGGSLIAAMVDSLGGVDGLDNAQNQLDYPASQYENLRRGFSA